MIREINSSGNSLLKSLLAGLMGAGIAVVCLIPPIVHMVTGPLGSLIGGVLSGLYIKASKQQIFIIGMTIGITTSVLLGITIFIILSVGLPFLKNNWFDMDDFSNLKIIKYMLLHMAYSSMLGMLGVYISTKVTK